MINIFKKNKINPITLVPGDTVKIWHNKTTADGTVVSRTLVAEHQVTKTMTDLDTAIIFEVENEAGLKMGIGGMVGK